MEKIKRYRKPLLAAVLLLFTLLAECLVWFMAGRMDSQQLAARWAADDSYAQVSVYFTPDACVWESQMTPFAMQLESAMEEAGAVSENSGGRDWVYAYSAQGTLTLTGKKNSITVKAYGVSGDFFLFHPLERLSGSLLFAGEGTEADTVILDENAAWQLFGATDVAGMCVEIGQTSYVIGGVVKSESGMFAEEAGAGQVTVYVPYWILEEQEEALTVANLEVLIKNPVKKFGADTVENLLKSYLGLDTEDYVLIENSTRYSISNRFQTLKNFGVRSMQRNGIIYPYWENRAAAVDDVAALILVLQLLLLLYPLICAAQFIHYLWKKKDVPWKCLVKLLSNSKKNMKSVKMQ